jgi:hypothetical protein
MRKRISRHIESCPACDEDRRRLVNPVALLGSVPVFIPAPSWLRGHTLSQVRLTSASANMSNTAGPGDPSSPNSPETAPTQQRTTLPPASTETLRSTAVAPGENQVEAVEHGDADAATAGTHFYARSAFGHPGAGVGAPNPLGRWSEHQ